MRLEGEVFAGLGRHTSTQVNNLVAFVDALGYHPFPGSLNVRLDEPVALARLGVPTARLTTIERGRWRFWLAEVEDVDAPIHVATWRRNLHSLTNEVELVSPVRLRDELEGERVVIEVPPCSS